MAAPVDTAQHSRARRPGGSTAAGRLGRRRRRSGNRGWLIVIVVAAVAAVAAFAGWALLASSWLAVSQVSVTGERTLSAQQVRAAAAVPRGTALVGVNLDSVQQRVSSLRQVANVTVHRSWPHTIAIAVTERQPVAVVSQSSQWELVDKTGALFRRVAAAPPGMPVIDVPSTRTTDVLRSAAAVVSSLPGDLLSRTRSVRAESLDSITLLLRDGRSVLWGNANQNRAKAQVLAVLLKHRATAYDVSVPAEPTLTSH